MTSLLEIIKIKYANYLNNPSYVYKSCLCDNDNNTIIILQKLEGETQTNESRKNIVDPRYAKFRASHLKVILIFDVSNPDIEYESSTNHIYEDIKIIYKKGEIIYPDKFDPCLENVCSNGIHYYKTIDPPFHLSISIITTFSVNKKQKLLYSGLWYSWHENGQLEMEAQVSKDIVDGKFIQYHENGQKSEEIQLLNGNLNGKYTAFYKLGQLKMMGEFINNKKNGKWLEWYENGFLCSERNYINNEKNGKMYEWYDNGQKHSECEYVNDKKQGKYTKWYYSEQNSNPQKWEEGEYLNDKKNGKWIEWITTDGKKYKEEEYLDDERIKNDYVVD
jgi:antitoxin component YwqK of YwqJK toxin-antitoxin module